jgi:histone acetyltransferase (RNA polymerase elongator complex component)
MKNQFARQRSGGGRPIHRAALPDGDLRDTELYEMYLRGGLQALHPGGNLAHRKRYVPYLTAAGINVIRVGLKSTDLISESGEVAGGYHPAFRQLVESEIAKEQMEAQLEQYMPFHPDLSAISFFSNAFPSAI